MPDATGSPASLVRSQSTVLSALPRSLTCRPEIEKILINDPTGRWLNVTGRPLFLSRRHGLGKTRMWIRVASTEVLTGGGSDLARTVGVDSSVITKSSMRKLLLSPRKPTTPGHVMGE